jgi:diguanylate cyclase (GGDEF)-like protein
LDQRFGALQVVRVITVALALATAAFAPKELGITVGRVLPLSIAYVGCCLAGQGIDHFWERTDAARSRPRRSRARLQQVLLPVDSLYLATLTVPSGGAQSDLIWLFTVQLIAVTLLASRRTGLRVAMWDSALLIGIALLKLNGPLGELLGAPQVYTPSAEAVFVRISGFWAVTMCTAYFSALSERELRRSKAQLDALTNMASQMAESMEAGCDAAQISAILLPSLLSPFGFTRAAVVWQRKATVTAARAVAAPGHAPHVEAVALVTSALEGSVARRALADHEPVLVSTLSPAADPVLAELLPSATNVVVVPLWAGRERQGLLLAESGPPSTRRMSRRSLEMVNRFAAHTALALSNADLREEISTLAASDSLTGLANRRALSSTLAREVARTRRTKRPLSLAIMDIDHFKQVNDTFGHLAGDEILRRVAEAMAANVRDEDLVARYGGEEFAVVLPDCGPESALAVVERVRAAVASANTATRVTVSAGIATMVGARTNGERLLAAADQALYVSKNSGRNRATAAPPAGSTPTPSALPVLDPDNEPTIGPTPGSRFGVGEPALSG